MAYLEIKRGETVTRAPLEADASSIGRHPDNTVVINDPDMSRRHCIIERSAGGGRRRRGFVLHDLGSRNGTRLNEMRVVREPLKHNDVIRIGDTDIRFIDEPEAAPAANASFFAARRPLLGGLGIGFAAGVLLTAWLGGILGDWFGSPLRPPAFIAKGSHSSESRSPREGSGDDGGVSSADGQDAAAAGTDESAAPVESEYDLVSGETLERMSRTHLDKPVRAVFYGSPAAAGDGALHWELPPDGRLVAVIEPGSQAFDLLKSEPAMLEVEVCGLLQSRPDDVGGGVAGLRLNVGEMVIRRSWKAAGGTGDAAPLRPGTQAALGRRLLVNARYAAASRRNAESG